MKKGFTLIELIGVIVLLGVIALIAFPVVTNSIKTARENAYKAQISEIIEASKKWGAEHTDNLPEIDSLDVITISISELIQEGYIKKTADGTLKDPRTENGTLTGCVVVSYSSELNQYEYKYDDDCEKE